MPDARPSAPAGAAQRDRVVARSAQWPAGWLVFSYLLGAAFVVLSATGPGPDDAARLDTPGLRVVLVAVDLIAAALALALTLRIRRRPSRWPIALLLVWLLLEGSESWRRASTAASPSTCSCSWSRAAPWRPPSR